MKDAVDDVIDRIEFLEEVRRFEDARLRRIDPSRARAYQAGLIIGILMVEAVVVG